MIRWILFFIFIFSFTNLWGQSELEKRLWTETNYNFDVLFNQDLSAENCYKSEKEFVGCLMAFNRLLSNIDEGGPYQIKVNGLNLEISPMTEKKTPKTLEEFKEFQEKLQKSFRTFFRTIPKST